MLAASTKVFSTELPSAVAQVVKTVSVALAALTVGPSRLIQRTPWVRASFGTAPAGNSATAALMMERSLTIMPPSQSTWLARSRAGSVFCTMMRTGRSGASWARIKSWGWTGRGPVGAAEATNTEGTNRRRMDRKTKRDWVRTGACRLMVYSAM